MAPIERYPKCHFQAKSAPFYDLPTSWCKRSADVNSGGPTCRSRLHLPRGRRHLQLLLTSACPSRGRFTANESRFGQGGVAPRLSNGDRSAGPGYNSRWDRALAPLIRTSSAPMQRPVTPGARLGRRPGRTCALRPPAPAGYRAAGPAVRRVRRGLGRRSQRSQSRSAADGTLSPTRQDIHRLGMVKIVRDMKEPPCDLHGGSFYYRSS